METIAKIRRDHYVHVKGFRRITRERKLSRNTVRKVIREIKTQFTYQRAILPLRKMGDYVEQLLSDNVELPRKQRLTLKLYERVSVVVTTNPSFGEWNKVFQDEKMTSKRCQVTSFHRSSEYNLQSN